MFQSYYREKEERSKLLTFLAVIGAACAIGAIIFAAYKIISKKVKVGPHNPKTLDRVDMNGDGVFDTVMLDTTGNGEVDTIIIDD